MKGYAKIKIKVKIEIGRDTHRYAYGAETLNESPTKKSHFFFFFISNCVKFIFIIVVVVDSFAIGLVSRCFFVFLTSFQ